MTDLLLIRHPSHDVLGRMPGIHLNEQGKREAVALLERLESGPVEALHASPLERSRETAAPAEGETMLEAQARALTTLRAAGRIP